MGDRRQRRGGRWNVADDRKIAVKEHDFSLAILPVLD
jgi:hypothetical protein